MGTSEDELALPNDATAFGWRDQAALLWIIVPYDDVDRLAAHEAWATTIHAELAGGAAPSYVNFMVIEPADAVRSGYPPATFARLRALKRRLDPRTCSGGTRTSRPAQRSLHSRWRAR